MKKEYYKTSNFYLSAYLYSWNQELVNIDKENPKKAIFVFIDSLEREELVSAFIYGQEAPVDAKKYAYAIKELKNKLYS